MQVKENTNNTFYVAAVIFNGKYWALNCKREKKFTKY